MVTQGYLPFHPSPKKPDIDLPPLACDSHCHVFGPAVKFPFSPTSSYLPVDAPKQTLFERHRFLGFSRAVIVQASCHGSDNAAMVDALEAGGDAYRGIAILRDDVDEAELRWLDAAGVRGVRFNFVKRLKAQRPISVYEEIIARVARLGWHIVVYFDAEDMAEIEPFLKTIPVPVIIDHMGRVPVAEGTKGEAFRRLARLLEDDKFWIKVSGAERLTKAGPPYGDVDEVARGLIATAPTRVLWGTDWPHPNMKSHVPDDGVLVDHIAAIAPAAAQRHGLLVDNPGRLYWENDGRHG